MRPECLNRFHDPSGSLKMLFVAAILLALSLALDAQPGKEAQKIPGDYCLTGEEIHLYRLINEYRMFFDLDIIPLSKSLSFVAHTHVRDLHENRPDLFSCNLHSWSDKGVWTPCCYAKDPNRTNCMWNKPRELTSYMGNGQEIILWENIPATPRSAFDQWRNFELTNNMLLNRGRWQENNWKAIGIAVYEGYASVWFGEVIDHEVLLTVCDDLSELTADWLIREHAVDDEPETVASEPVPVYYLIVSSFKERSQAEAEVKRLQKGGYTDAKMIEKDNNFRVSVHDYTELTEAQKMRRQLNNVFKGIWIMEN
mgnify:CR=1 FL=1